MSPFSSSSLTLNGLLTYYSLVGGNILMYGTRVEDWSATGVSNLVVLNRQTQDKCFCISFEMMTYKGKLRRWVQVGD